MATNEDSFRLMETNEFRCDICEVSFTAKSSLKRHVGVKHSGFYTCKFCRRTCDFGILEKRAHEELCPQKPDLSELKCAICMKQYQSKDSYRRHMKTHNGGLKYACSECDKTFSDHINFTSHQASHQRSPQFECKQCGAMFKDQRNCQKHEEAHEIDKSMKCILCDKIYSRNSSLRVHS